MHKIKHINFFSPELLLLYLILLIGFWLRIQGVLHGTFAFTYDVGRDLLALRNMIYAHKFPLIGFTTGLQGIFYGPWWYYFLLPAFIVSQGNPSGMVAFMALTGTVTTVIGYVIGKKVQGDFFGLLLASFLSFSSLMVGLASQLWNPKAAPLAVILTVLLLILVPNRKKKLPWIYLGIGLLLALSQEFEFVYALYPHETSSQFKEFGTAPS